MTDRERVAKLRGVLYAALWFLEGDSSATRSEVAEEIRGILNETADPLPT